MALQVLLAEDEVLVAMALADFLEMEGHRVRVASDGLVALEAARDLESLDLLITDLRMPNLGGEDLIRALWAERPGLPVIVVTGSAPPGGMAALRQDVGNRGPLLLLHKPIEYQDLTKALYCITSAAPDQAVTPGRVDGFDQDGAAGEGDAGGVILSRLLAT